MALSKVITMKVMKKIRVTPSQVGSINPTLDLLSKVFILSQAVLGVNRLALFPNLRNVYNYIAFAYFLLFIGITLYFLNSLQSISIEIYLGMLQYSCSAILGFILCKRMRGFYIELTKFDRKVGCTPKVSRNIYGKVTGAILITLILGLNFYLSHLPLVDVLVPTLPVTYIGVQIVRYIELFFIGHLFDLLFLRLRLINYYMQSSFDYSKSQLLQEYEVLAPTIRDNNVKIKHIMDLYQIIVSAHVLLVHSVKWQVLIQITIAFLSLLSFSYKVTIPVIHGTINVQVALVFVCMLVVFLVSAVAPCSSSERVHREALRLRALLATRLYNNKLDKLSRSVARALIALTETRDLSFSLMNMFTFDLSFPFTFTSLLVTYLMIFLQFDKVMNS